jgi:hypothetical protein
MSHSRKLFLAPVLVALTLAGAGCAKSEHIAGYEAAIAPLVRLSSEHGSGTPSANGFAQMATGFDDARARLGALESPDSAQDELDRTLAAIDASSEHVRVLADAVGSGDADRITAATREYAASGSELLEAEAALRFAVGA